MTYNGTGPKGTINPTNERNEIMLPAGTYSVIQNGESTLVGTRSGILPGLIPSILNIDMEKGIDSNYLLHDFYENYDKIVDSPKAGVPTSVCWGSHPITFIGDLNMGNNHCGWTDGFFVIPDFVIDKIKEFNPDFDPYRSIFTIDEDSTLSINENYDMEVALDNDDFFSWISLSGTPLVTESMQFAGTQGTI